MIYIVQNQLVTSSIMNDVKVNIFHLQNKEVNAQQKDSRMIPKIKDEAIKYMNYIIKFRF